MIDGEAGLRSGNKVAQTRRQTLVSWALKFKFAQNHGTDNMKIEIVTWLEEHKARSWSNDTYSPRVLSGLASKNHKS